MLSVVSRIARIVLHQNMIVRQWGALKQSVGQIGIYVTMINTVMVAVTLYSTGWVQQNVMEIRFVPFMGTLFVLIGFLLLLSWKMDVPSFFSSWNQQFWEHDNLMRKYLEERFENIDKRLTEIEDKLETPKKEQK